MEVDFMFHVYLMIFLFAHLQCKTLFFDDCIVDLHDFTDQGHIISPAFPHLCQCKFLHGFRMRLGIDFGPMLAPFCRSFSGFLAVVFVNVFLDRNFTDF